MKRKVNLLHLVFGHKVVEDENLDNIIAGTFGNTYVIRRYYDTGKFRTAQQDMLKHVIGWTGILKKYRRMMSR